MRLREFGAFVWKQVLSSLFPLYIFLVAWVSDVVPLPLARYDFLLLACLAMQAFMVFAKVETTQELKLICLFHILGLGLELYKVQHGSWSYPGDAMSKAFGVPAFSGFMYASVASYMTQAWRRFDLAIENWPRSLWGVVIAGAIYANFFLNRYLSDLRWLLAGIVFVVFWRTRIQFTNTTVRRQMPAVLSFTLIGLFVWFAENICTYLRVWQYAHQAHGWTWVDLSKLSSWCLLVIVSFLIVAKVKVAPARSSGIMSKLQERTSPPPQGISAPRGGGMS